MNEKIDKRRREGHSLKNVVSLRINDDELKFLERLQETTSKTVSEIMRDAFQSLQRGSLHRFQS